MKKTLNPTLILLMITMLAHLSGMKSAKAQALLENTIYERLWMTPRTLPFHFTGINNPGVDIDLDSADHAHMVLNRWHYPSDGQTSIIYMFRQSSNWYYIVADVVEAGIQLLEPKIRISDNGLVHITYFKANTLHYLTVDHEKNITHHPGIAGTEQGSSLLLNEQGFPVISYKIPVIGEESKSFVVSEFNGNTWLSDTLSVTSSSVSQLDKGMAHSLTRMFRDSENRINVVIYKEFAERAEFVWNRKEGDAWNIVDRSPAPVTWGHNRFWGIDLIADANGNIRACYGSDLQFRYMWSEDDQLFDDYIMPGSNFANCKITFDQDETPVVFGLQSGIEDLHVAKKSDEDWIISRIPANPSKGATSVTAKTDNSGDIHLLLYQNSPSMLIYTTGSDLQDGIFTGLNSSATESARFDVVITSSNRIHAFFTDFKPETSLINNQLQTYYYPFRDVLLKTEGETDFVRTVTERDPDDRRFNKKVAQGADQFIKFNHSKSTFSDVGAHRIYTYESHLYTSMDGIEWTEQLSMDSLNTLNPKLIYALDRYWLLDASGHLTSNDGVEWQSQGLIAELFDPTDIIVFGKDFAFGDRLFVLVHNQGRQDNSDPACLVCPTERSGYYMLIYSDEEGWSSHRLTNLDSALSFQGFLSDDAGLINVGIGATRRSVDGINWTSESNNLDRVPGQVVKTGDFYFLVDKRLYNWNNQQMEGNLRISRDGLSWQRVPFEDRYVSGAKYRLAATEDRLLLINVVDGIIYDWGESQGLFSDDAQIIPFDRFTRDPEENLFIAGRWSSVPGDLNHLSAFSGNVIASNYPDLYGLFAHTRSVINSTNYSGVIQYWNGSEWEIITPLNRGFGIPYVFHDGERTRLVASSTRRATTGDRQRRIDAWDGESWTTITDAEYNMISVTFTTWNHDGVPKLVVSGLGSPAAEKFMGIWDGSDWTYFSGQSYENRLPAGAVTAASYGGVEYLYAAGNLMSIDGVNVQRIARYDGVSWEPVQGGVNGEARQMVTMRSMSGGDDTIVLNGDFDRIIGDSEIEVSGMAVYDGDSWSKIEPELDGAALRLRRMLVYETRQGHVLFAAGQPDMDPRGILNSIGAWDGENWFQLDNGIGGGPAEVWSMDIFQESGGPVLYVMGFFNRAGDIGVDGFARIPLYDVGQRIQPQVINLSDGESQLIPLPEAGLSLFGDVTNAGWLSATLLTNNPVPENLPDHLLGVVNMMWEFETESVEISNMLLAFDVPDAESMFGKLLGEIAPEGISGIEDALVWLMEYEDGWTDLGGVIGNNQLVSVTPTSTLTRATIGILKEPQVTQITDSELPLEFLLGQNYPNPFNPTTTIEFQLPRAVITRLDVYDVLGRRVGTLVNDNLSAGTHRINFDASMFASGLYFYRIQAGDRVAVRKMMLVK